MRSTGENEFVLRAFENFVKRLHTKHLSKCTFAFPTRKAKHLSKCIIHGNVTVQLDISATEYSLTAHAQDKIGTQFK